LVIENLDLRRQIFHVRLATPFYHGQAQTVKINTPSTSPLEKGDGGFGAENS